MSECVPKVKLMIVFGFIVFIGSFVAEQVYSSDSYRTTMSFSFGFILFSLVTYLNILTFKSLFEETISGDNSPKLLVYILPGFKFILILFLLLFGFFNLELSGLLVGAGALISLILLSIFGVAEYRSRQKNILRPN